ncbi:hypothetical protein LCGC14_2604730, partial [marine sediment metagenome]
ADDVVKNVADKIKSEKISPSKIKTSVFHLNIITDVIYLHDPLQWENKDGMYFQWSDFRSFYLPYEIAKMSIPKIEILDKLAASSGLASSLWKKPEGLVYRLVTQAFSA